MSTCYWERRGTSIYDLGTYRAGEYQPGSARLLVDLHPPGKYDATNQMHLIRCIELVVEAHNATCDKPIAAKPVRNSTLVRI